MQIYVDADACPVVRIIEELAGKYGIPVTLLCDTNREFDTLKCKKVPQSLEIGLFFCQIFIFII